VLLLWKSYDNETSCRNNCRAIWAKCGSHRHPADRAWVIHWGGNAECANYPPFLKKQEIYFNQAIIWNKMHPNLTRKDRMDRL
jgi:hypothetical protein